MRLLLRLLFLAILAPLPVHAAQIPTDFDQYVLELINRGRADPAAEATRYTVDLNEGLAPGTITTAPKQPLAFNPFLIDAAQGHSQWMLDQDTFSHTGDGGSQPADRMETAGYIFTAPFGSGENIGWNGSSAAIDHVQAAGQAHQDLFVDFNYPGRGHRLNLMNPDFREIGVGALFGVFTEQATPFNAAMVTEDFAYSEGSNAGLNYITGVAWQDTVIPDDFYTPGGEGLGGVTVSATHRITHLTYTATTWPSGGYSLAVPAGIYDVVAHGGAMGGAVAFNAVELGTRNVKIDFPAALAKTGAEVTVYCRDTLSDDNPEPSRASGTDFGSAGFGKPGPRRTFTVRNDGDSALVLGPVSVPVGYTLIKGLTSPIAPGGHDTFIARLDSLAVGTFGGEIQFDTNDSDEGTFNFHITGRINPSGTGPVVVAEMLDVSVQSGDGPTIIDLHRHFDDIGIDGTLVRMTTVLGSADLELADNVTPGTVANFLNYVAGGDYADAFFHRAVPGFVVQGGGYAWPEGVGLIAVPTDGPIANEYDNWFDAGFGGLPPGTPVNVRGTVAMAKLGGDPDSATSQWFVNAADNSDNLDGQNGGFTVFGKVLRGMDLFDQILDAADPTVTIVDAASPFDSLPVIDLQPGQTQLNRSNVILTTAISPVPELSFTLAANDNPSLVTPTISDEGILTLDYATGAYGSAVITIRATSTGGDIAEDTVQITVAPSSAGDINDDGVVNMADLILNLQVLAGTGTLPEDFFPRLSEVEINNDGRLGPEESLYILQQISGTRAP